MAEDHGAPEAGKLPRASTRGRRETEVVERQRSPKSERRKESVAGQCRMRWGMSWDECPKGSRILTDLGVLFEVGFLVFGDHGCIGTA